MDKCKNCSEISSNFFNRPYKEIVKNNYLKEIKSNDKLIVTYNYLLALLKDFQTDGVSALGDSEMLSLIPEKEIYNAVKDGDIQIVE